MIEELKKYEALNLEVFLVVNKEYWSKYEEILQDIPFKIRFVDPATPKGISFTYEMISLNEKAYGKGMAAPSWTFANFGTIGAGITGGFLSNSVPISKISIVGNLSNENIAHEWTLLVDPELEGKKIGSLSFALALELVKHKQFLTFMIQTDNPSSNIYLKNINPLKIMSYGFVHTKKNSLLIKTEIPKEKPFQTILRSKMPKYKFEDFEVATHDLPSGENQFWIKEDNHSLYLNLNENINHGYNYFLKGKIIKEGFSYFLIEKTS